MKAAKAWNVQPPSRFYEYSELDRAVMIQFVLESEGMAAYQGEMDKQAQDDQMRNMKNRPRGS